MRIELLFQPRVPTRLFQALPLCAAVLLSGCASLSKEECQQGDWRQIGFADGASGQSAAYINEHSKACAEYGVRPDLDSYLRGREQGLLTYCQAENGFSVGRQGKQHNVADCPENMKPGFIEQYRQGQQVYNTEQELKRQRSRIDTNNHQIRRNDDRLNQIRRDLGRSDLSSSRRTDLLNEFDRLVSEKDRLSRDNSTVQYDVNRLQMQLQRQLDGRRW